MTRLNGHGPALLVVPDGMTPFEAYNPILDKKGQWGAAPVFTDPTPRGITFEGFYEWSRHEAACVIVRRAPFDRTCHPIGSTLRGMAIR